MRTHILTLRYSPTLGAFDTAPLDNFTRNREVVTFREHFFRIEGVPHLACVVQVQEPPVPVEVAAPCAPPTRRADRKTTERKDPTAGLGEADRLLFNSIREWRTSTARDEGVPPYLVLTNKQVLALIAKRPQSLTTLGQQDGIGKGKVERYGKHILRLLNGTQQATAEEPSS